MEIGSQKFEDLILVEMANSFDHSIDNLLICFSSFSFLYEIITIITIIFVPLPSSSSLVALSHRVHQRCQGNPRVLVGLGGTTWVLD